MEYRVKNGIYGYFNTVLDECHRLKSSRTGVSGPHTGISFARNLEFNPEIKNGLQYMEMYCRRCEKKLSEVDHLASDTEGKFRLFKPPISKLDPVNAVERRATSWSVNNYPLTLTGYWKVG